MKGKPEHRWEHAVKLGDTVKHPVVGTETILEKQNSKREDLKGFQHKEILFKEKGALTTQTGTSHITCHYYHPYPAKKKLTYYLRA